MRDGGAGLLGGGKPRWGCETTTWLCTTCDGQPMEVDAGSTAAEEETHAPERRWIRWATCRAARPLIWHATEVRLAQKWMLTSGREPRFDPPPPLAPASSLTTSIHATAWRMRREASVLVRRQTAFSRLSSEALGPRPATTVAEPPGLAAGAEEVGTKSALVASAAATLAWGGNEWQRASSSASHWR